MINKKIITLLLITIITLPNYQAVDISKESDLKYYVTFAINENSDFECNEQIAENGTLEFHIKMIDLTLNNWFWEGSLKSSSLKNNKTLSVHKNAYLNSIDNIVKYPLLSLFNCGLNPILNNIESLIFTIADIEYMGDYLANLTNNIINLIGFDKNAFLLPIGIVADTESGYGWQEVTDENQPKTQNQKLINLKYYLKVYGEFNQKISTNGTIRKFNVNFQNSIFFEYNQNILSGLNIQINQSGTIDQLKIDRNGIFTFKLANSDFDITYDKNDYSNEIRIFILKNGFLIYFLFILIFITKFSKKQKK